MNKKQEGETFHQRRADMYQEESEKSKAMEQSRVSISLCTPILSITHSSKYLAF